jgi:hypothetical protein
VIVLTFADVRSETRNGVVECIWLELASRLWGCREHASTHLKFALGRFYDLLKSEAAGL